MSYVHVKLMCIAFFCVWTFYIIRIYIILWKKLLQVSFFFFKIMQMLCPSVASLLLMLNYHKYELPS